VTGVSSLASFLADLRTAAVTGAWLDGEERIGLDGTRAKKRLDAEVITAALLTEDEVRSLRLCNFVIEGTARLAGLSLARDFSLEHCEVEGDLELGGGEIGALRIVHTAIRGSLKARELSVANSMILDDSMVRDGVFAANSRIGGRVSCDRLNIPRGTMEEDGQLAFSLEGAAIGGRLSAVRLDAGGQVNLNGAAVDGELDLTDAKLGGSRTSLRVENAHVKATAFIKSSSANGDFHARGNISFAGSEFAGGLNCTGLNVEGQEDSTASEPILDARNVKVGGECFINHATIAGGITLTAAEIHGQLNLSGLKLTGTPEASLDARSMRIGTDVWLDDCFESSAAVILERCAIGGNVNAVAGRFQAQLGEDARYTGLALSLASATIDGSLVLADEDWTARREAWNGTYGFVAIGTVVLTDTHVRRRLELSGGVFRGCGADALRADGIRVDADARLAGGVGARGQSAFRAEGPVRLTRGKVQGTLDLTGAQFGLGTSPGKEEREQSARSIVFDGSLMRIGDRLVLRDLELDGQITLAGAQVGTLSDDKSYWQDKAGSLDLDAFSYSFLERDELGWRYGRDWLAHLARYRAQPYLQLAKVERDMGRGKEARRISIERHRARLGRRPAPQTRNPALWIVTRTARLADRAVGALVGWGYAPWRLASVWVVMLAIAVIIFHWAGTHDELRPSALPAFTAGRPPSSSHCRPNYPCFESLTYSLDDILPIVDLKQRDYWYVDTRTQSGRWVGVANLVFTLLGWIFATLLAASFTNVLRRE
jgi:hypothetical protein